MLNPYRPDRPTKVMGAVGRLLGYVIALAFTLGVVIVTIWLLRVLVGMLS